MEKFSAEEMRLIKYGIFICAFMSFIAFGLGYQSGEFATWKNYLNDAEISECSKERGYCTLRGTPDGYDHELPY